MFNWKKTSSDDLKIFLKNIIDVECFILNIFSNEKMKQKKWKNFYCYLPFIAFHFKSLLTEKNTKNFIIWKYFSDETSNIYYISPKISYEKASYVGTLSYWSN